MVTKGVWQGIFFLFWICVVPHAHRRIQWKMFKISSTWYSAADSWTPTWTKPFPSTHRIWTQLWHAHLYLALCHFLLSHPLNSYSQTSTLQVFHLQAQFYSQCSPCSSKGSTITVATWCLHFLLAQTYWMETVISAREEEFCLCLVLLHSGFQNGEFMLEFLLPQGKTALLPLQGPKPQESNIFYPIGRKTSYQFFKMFSLRRVDIAPKESHNQLLDQLNG